VPRRAKQKSWREFRPVSGRKKSNQIGRLELKRDRVTVIRNGLRLSREHVQYADSQAAPVLKWAGGKQWLAKAAPLFVPPKFGRYYEPFFGGGAMFFSLAPGRATVADRNEELVATYRAIRDDVEGIIRVLGGYRYNKNVYYKTRSLLTRAEHTAAARFIYLNRTCFNGLFRVNRTGRFNTPYGNYVNPTICNSDRLRAVSVSLKRVTLLAGDFERTTARAKAGDFAYFDPPYITGHKDNGFLKYNSRLFTWDDQQRLARWAAELKARGVHVLVSNADHRAVRALYPGFRVLKVSRRASIAGENTSRGQTSEILLSSYPILPTSRSRNGQK